MNPERRKENLQISYITALCAAIGASFELQRDDEDSTDGIIKKRIDIENMFFDASIRIQLKCTSSASQFTEYDDYISYKLKVKNYNDMCTPATIPIILGLLILPEDDNTWIKWSTEELLIKGCMYWADFSHCKKSDNKENITVKLQKNNVLNQQTIYSVLDKLAKGEWL